VAQPARPGAADFEKSLSPIVWAHEVTAEEAIEGPADMIAQAAVTRIDRPRQVGLRPQSCPVRFSRAIVMGRAALIHAQQSVIARVVYRIEADASFESPRMEHFGDPVWR